MAMHALGMSIFVGFHVVFAMHALGMSIFVGFHVVFCLQDQFLKKLKRKLSWDAR